MNVSISLKVRSKETGLTSRLKVEKKNITKTQADQILKEIKGIAPDPKALIKGSDSGSLVVKIDNKPAFTQKFRKVAAHSLNIYTPAVNASPVEKKTKAEKPVAKKTVAKKAPAKKAAK